MNTKPTHLGFLLLPEYSMIAFSSGIEPLRMANRLSGKNLYQWSVITPDGETVKSSSGLSVLADHSIEDTLSLDILFVCGGVNVQNHADKAILFWLKKMEKLQIGMGAICTGTYLLAKAGLLDNHRCTIHWENMASMREEFPNIIISSELFEIDKNRYTCAGGVATLDLMLNLIKRQHGAELAASISEEFILERIRNQHDRQRIPLKQFLGTGQPKLIEAVTLMESNIEEPMSLDELAYHVGLSRRQLERLFQKYLQCVPTRYYLELRLKRARELLLQTSKSIVDVAFACGFVSAPHFSKCYRDMFGIAPRDERRFKHKNDDTEKANIKTITS